MPHFKSEGFSIAYEVYGEGVPVLLIHGFASTGAVNWRETGWVTALTNQGYQVITIDNRGHGASEKIYDEAPYDARLMAHDAANLIDHLNLGRVAVMGYSMGGRISTFLAVDAPEKVAALIIGGMGARLLRPRRNSDEIRTALLAPSLDVVSGEVGRQFRRFAERTESDLRALAACVAGPSSQLSEADFAGLDMPVLIAVGSDDDIAGSPDELARLIPKGEAFVIPGRDHMRATGDPAYKTAVKTFLGRHYPPGGVV